jgi:hypothetical protein
VSRFSSLPAYTANMRRRLRIALAVCLLSLGGVIAWQVLSPGEPVYQGKSLGDWIKLLDYGGGHRYRTGVYALRQMGTNSLPALIRYLSYRDPAWKTALTRLKARSRLFSLEDSETDWHCRAAKACAELGAQAEPAFPAMAAAAGDPGASDVVVRSLVRLLPKSAHVLTNLLTTGNQETRRAVAEHFREGFSYPELATATLIALTNALSDPDIKVQAAVVTSLGSSSTQTNLTLPVLAQVSTNTSFPPRLRQLAVTALRGATPAPMPPEPPRRLATQPP